MERENCALFQKNKCFKDHPTQDIHRVHRNRPCESKYKCLQLKSGRCPDFHKAIHQFQLYCPQGSSCIKLATNDCNFKHDTIDNLTK